MENKTLSKAAAMAQFRLAVIAPVIHGLYPDASHNAYYECILYGGAHYPIRRTDKVENCRTKRNNLPVIDYSKTGGSK